MLRSAAASTINTRPSTDGRKPALVSSFMRNDVRMGHTLHSSFVITVLAADAADESRRFKAWEPANAGKPAGTDPVYQPQDDADPVSFPRQVMSTLATGLSAAHDLLATSGRSVPLEEAIQSGVTLQMLESVKAMSAPEGIRALDMAFRLAKLEPVKEDVPQQIEMVRDATSSSVSDVIARFAKVPDVEYDEILGKAVRLERAEGSEDGQIVVDGSVGKARRRVKVPLSGEAYRLAIAAHEDSTRSLWKELSPEILAAGG